MKYAQGDKWRLYQGDCREEMRKFRENFFGSAITDPPYDLTAGKKGGTGVASLNPNSPAGRSRIGTGFMGKKWDGTGVAFRPETWAEVLRVVKPGGMLFAFGGTRTYHRLACAIEDAGWEIRDCIMWLYGSGFPKSLDISKAMDKSAGAEREVVGLNHHAHKRTGAAKEGTFDNRGPGLGGLESARVTAPATDLARQWNGWGTALKPAFESIIVAMKPLDGTFAENAEKWGVAGLNIDNNRIPCEGGSPAAARRASARNSGNAPMQDRVLGVVKAAEANNIGKIGRRGSAEVYMAEREAENLGRWPANVILDEAAGALLGEASRFFYCAKAPKSERGKDNKHPTVKPISLMKYLVGLVKMPTPQWVLDPFCGSGSTGVACRMLGVPFVGIDSDETEGYLDVARERLEGVVTAK